jgi:tetratricopeptide (TPR) repeat protein
LAARAAVMLWTGRLDDSIAAAELSGRLNSNLGPETALNLGIAYLVNRRYADAVKLLEATRTRYPGYPLLDFPLAGAYAELDRGAEAAEALERGKSKNPYLDLPGFGSRFQDPALKRRLDDSLRKAGLS